ncbi:hypothetical protein ACJJTC_003617 [Scirpophaga incertulas]
MELNDTVKDLGLSKDAAVFLGYTNTLVFYVCEIVEQHWTTTDWPPKRGLTPGEKKNIKTTLVPPEKVLPPLTHIKCGLIKQFVKSLQKDGNCFRYICSKFPKLPEAKLKEGVFTVKNTGKRFHQDVRHIERRYQGRSDVSMLADYCWMLKRHIKERNQKRIGEASKKRRKGFTRKKIKHKVGHNFK